MPALDARPDHELNNLFCKIIGSAELALDRVQDPGARTELELIIELTERGAELVRTHPMTERV